jgi:hypothetical protein
MVCAYDQNVGNTTRGIGEERGAVNSNDCGPADLRRHFAALRYDDGYAYDGRPSAL